MIIEETFGSDTISPEELQLLSETMTGFIELGPEEDLYRYIGECLCRFAPGSFAVVNSFDETNRAMVTKAFAGVEPYFGTVQRLFGRLPLGVSHSLSERSHDLMVKNHIVRFARFDEVAMAGIDPTIRQQLTDLLADRQVYIMMFRYRGKIFADALWLIGTNVRLPNRHLVEAFYQGASVALSRRRAEEALQESEEHFRALFEHSCDLQYVLDLEANILDINEAGVRLIGKPREELLGSNAFPLFPPASRAAMREQLAKKLSGRASNTVYEAEINTPRGRIPLEISTYVIHREGQPFRIQGSARDITERKRVVEEREAIAAQQIETLQQANRLKDEFLSVISHELRTPLNAIMGFGSLLSDEVPGLLSPAQMPYVEKILRASERMLRLIDDLLDLAKLRAGMLDIHPAPTAFLPLAEEALASVEPLAREKAIRLSQEIRLEGEYWLDGARLIQVLLNLLHNAVKFTPEGGRVALRAFLEGEEIVAEVEDTGIGIDPSDRGKLFTPFKQLDMGLTRRAQGTGLGLSICKGLLEAHGGTIEVENAREGRGTCFRFRLPCNQASQHSK